MLNSDYAGHRLTFQLFAQSPPFAHLAAVYRNFDWDGPLDFVRKAAGLSERVMDRSARAPGDGAVSRWFGEPERTSAPANKSNAAEAAA
jgi:4-hydroxyphenylacetate 3-monooxygenase